MLVIRCQRLFWRLLAATLVFAAAAMPIFVLFPVVADGYRPTLAELGPPTTFIDWGVYLTFYVDPPTNLFPSFHLGIATLAAYAAWAARPLYGAFTGAIALGIGISICTMKQHFIADGVATFVLATIAWRFATRTYVPTPLEARAAPWPWFAGFFVLQALIYAGCYALYASGFRPWEDGVLLWH